MPLAALPADWRTRSITVGPVTFLYARELAQQPAGQFRPERAVLLDELRREHHPGVRRRIVQTLEHEPRGGLAIEELLIMIDAGHSATVTVPAKNRKHFALAYSPRALNAEHPKAAGVIKLTDGDTSVRFTPCHRERRQWLGGIIANRPGCQPIDITLSSGQRLRRYLPLGTGHRPCERS